MAKAAKRAPAGKSTDGASRPSLSEQASEDIIEGGPKRAWVLFAVFGVIIAIMIGFFLYAQTRDQNAIEENQYNGFDFWEAAGGVWVTRIEARGQPYDIPFYFHPRDTESVIIDRTALDLLVSRPDEVYISVDPDAGPKVVIGGVEIARILGSRYDLYNLNTKSALSRYPDTAIDITVLGCENATPERVVIQFVEGKQNLIGRLERYPNCIILQYTDANESIRVADRFAYLLLKIQ